MAEGILRQSAGDLIDVASAGAEPSGYVHPMALQVMREIGLNLTGHRSKHLEEFQGRAVNTVITVCDHANDVCPVFPGHPTRYHWSFADPAKAAGSKTEIESCFRSVRDQIRLVFEAYGAGLRDASVDQRRPQDAAAAIRSIHGRPGGHCPRESPSRLWRELAMDPKCL